MKLGKMKTIAKVLFLLTNACLMALLVGCNGAEEQKAEQAKYVKTVKVKSNNGNKVNSFSGKVEELKDVNLSFRVGGPMVTLKVEEGDYVKKGEVIAEIDDRDYIIRYNQAKAAYEQTKSEFKRYKELYKRKKISANNYEKFETAYINAENNYKSADNALRDTKLIAPFSGYIYKKEAEKFETVGPGTPIVSIIDMSKMDISIHLTESQLGGFNKLQNVYCKIAGAKEDSLPLKVKSINKKSNGADLYGVKLSLNNPNNKIKPGMTADVYVEYSSGNESKTLIPTNAVFSIEQTSYVWIYNKTTEKVNKKKIKLGDITSNGKIEVLSGLKHGDVIVSAGVHSLSENQKVKLLKAKSRTNVGGLL